MHGKIVDNGNKNELPWGNKAVIIAVYTKLKLHIVVLISNVFDYTKHT